MLKSSTSVLQDVSPDMLHFLTLFYARVHTSKSRQKERNASAFYSLSILQMFHSTEKRERISLHHLNSWKLSKSALLV
jgi:hypothetical protein